METTQVLTTTNLDSPDVCITKTETIDVEFARQLVKLTTISKEERDKIRRILKECKNGNKLDIIYKLGKNCKHEFLGRFCSLKGLGLQNLKKDIRSALSQDYYWDIDMVNAQPTLLKQYCEQNGFDCTYLKKYIDEREEILNEICDQLQIERWEAKEKVVSIIFGGSVILTPWFDKFTEEIKKIQRCIWDKNFDKLKWIRNQPNHLGKGTAYILQTCERECLLALDRSLTKHGRSLDVFMHDGGLVLKKDETEFPKGLLQQLEKDIYNDTKFSIKLIIKPNKTTFTKEIEEEEIIDDTYASKKFTEICKSRIIYDSGIVWIFDDTTGIWSCEDTHIQRVITNCGDKLIFKQGDKIFNYSGIVKNTKNLMIKLPDILPINNGYMLSKSKTDIGKLLFTNGIYDFFTNTFTHGFNPEIVFKASMPRAFPIKDQEKVNFIREISFIDAFAVQGNRDVLLHNLMRASIGDFRKKLCIGLGFTNSGKGMLTQLVRNAFGSYCSTFNGNSLIGSYDGAESSRKNGWITDIANSRFAFSSEIQIDEKNNISIDGNLLKNIASGGDELKVRKLYQNDQTIINKSTLFIFANDMPKISPIDDAIRDRVQVINWSFSYVDQPKKIHEKKCNPELSNLYNHIEYGDAFFWLMVEEYQKWKSNNFKEPEIPDCVLQGKDDILPIIDIEEILKEKYELTKNPEDSIPFVLIQEWLKENGVKDSITKIGRELNALGLISKDIKKDRKTIRIRTGIREI